MLIFISMVASMVVFIDGGYVSYGYYITNGYYPDGVTKIQIYY